MIDRRNTAATSITERMDVLEKKFDELHRWQETQTQVNLRNAEIRKDHGEHLKRHGRELELLFLSRHARTWRERRDAVETLALLRAELDAPSTEMAVAADEDDRRRDFAALVVIFAWGSAVLMVVGLFVWWALS